MATEYSTSNRKKPKTLNTKKTAMNKEDDKGKVKK